MKVCSVNNCGRFVIAKGLCNAHYTRLKRTGDVQAELLVTRSHFGSSNPKWKGGQTTDGRGRTLLHRPDHPSANKWGYVYRYRILVEESIGRFLTSDEIVHHKDGDKSNDAIENLEIMSQSNHIAEHRDQMSNGIRRFFKNNQSPWVGRKHTEETKAKIRADRLATLASKKWEL